MIPEVTCNGRKKGRARKEDVIEFGYNIVDEKQGQTLTELGIRGWSWEKKVQNCIGFRCSSKLYGCVPVFDPIDILRKGLTK